jgi:hypothetical protein
MPFLLTRHHSSASSFDKALNSEKHVNAHVDSTMSSSALASLSIQPRRQHTVAGLIRGRPHGKGDWKVRICGYVGCHDVMTSKSRQHKHYAKHRRENDPAKTRLKERNLKRLKKTTKRIENKT